MCDLTSTSLKCMPFSVFVMAPGACFIPPTLATAHYITYSICTLLIAHCNPTCSSFRGNAACNYYVASGIKKRSARWGKQARYAQESGVH